MFSLKYENKDSLNTLKTQWLIKANVYINVPVMCFFWWRQLRSLNDVSFELSRNAIIYTVKLLSLETAALVLMFA